jgi:protein archease
VTIPMALHDDWTAEAAVARRVLRPGHRAASGHWSVPGVTQVRIEAWAPTREGCVAEAAAATVDSFADVDSSVPWHFHQCLVPRQGSRHLLSGVLDEVIFDMRSVGVVPVWVRARPAEVGVYLEIGGVDVDEVRRGGDLPRSVAAKGLAMRRTGHGWSASAVVRH